MRKICSDNRDHFTNVRAEGTRWTQLGTNSHKSTCRSGAGHAFRSDAAACIAHDGERAGPPGASTP
jgi:hypothetical protein